MSDYEDDVDMDGSHKDETQFSSDNLLAKGKKVIADLPVGLEDNLPWYVVHVLFSF
jgi:replication factor C subunit 3/5